MRRNVDGPVGTTGLAETQFHEQNYLSIKTRHASLRVADLQGALQICLDRSAVLAGNPSKRQQFFELLKAERAAEIYGAATSKLVATFQGEQHLLASGAADEAAANAFNALLL